MDKTPSKLINSYCCYFTTKALVFLVNGHANAGDIFKISRENLRDCFSRDSDDPEIPEPDQGTKRITVSFKQIISVTETNENDLLVFTFDSDANPDDSFIMTPELLNA